MATDRNDQATAAMPLPGAGARMFMAPVAGIVASLTNPRKTFDQAKLRELADSIAPSGVHQPILVRPLPASRVEETSRAKGAVPVWPFATTRKAEPIEYELVAGERRWRACQLAGVAEIPVMARELSDEQVLEIQIVENLQREDVTPLEEAEGYAALMKTGGGMTAEEVGAKIGKSRSYIYGRLKVLDLCANGRDALREGKIDFSRALLIARIANEELQAKALRYCTNQGWTGEPPSYRECAQHIQAEYMLKLSAARFTIADASLVPDAGSCNECPKRTGANPDLFADVKSADVCTDPKCYARKEDAHTAQVVAKAKEKGQTVIAGQEAQELATSGYNMKLRGYRRLDNAEDSPTDQPLRKIIGAQMKAEGIAPTMIENPRKKGELLATLPNEVALRLLKAVESQAQAAKAVAKEVREFADEKKAKADSKAKAQYEQAWRDMLLQRTWEQLNQSSYAKPTFTLDVHRYLALRKVKSLSSDDARAVAAVLGLDKVGAHSALVDFAKDTISPDWLLLLLLLCIMQQDSSAHDHSYGGRVANEGLHLVSGIVFGESAPEIAKEVKAQARERYLPKPTPKKPAAPEGTSTPPPAAQASPTRAKAKKSTAPAALARDAARVKTTAAEAQAQIAAELRALEDANQAPAAQGDDAAAVAGAQPQAAPHGGAAGGAQATEQAPTAQGDEAPPAARALAAASAAPQASATPSTPAPAKKHQARKGPAQATACAAAPNGQASAGVGTGAAEEVGIGARVRVNETATFKQQKPWIGYEGNVVAQISASVRRCSMRASDMDSTSASPRATGAAWAVGAPACASGISAMRVALI